MRIHARHYASGIPIELHWTNGIIHALGPPTEVRPDYRCGWVAPALFDLQINGCAGISFNSSELTASQVYHVVQTCREHGIGQLLPTLITNDTAALRLGFSVLRQARDADPALAWALPGYHLEGPYISPDDGPRGAHPRQHVRPPDWEEFRRLQEAAGGCIRLVTLAPEIAGAIPFIEQLVRAGVVVAIGHTAATGKQIVAAIAAGARLSTHLGNGSHALLPRHQNYVWEQLAADDLWASLIADGQHLPPALVKCIIRLKTPGRCILTCDASSLAGLPPGRYRQWNQDIDIFPEGRVVVAGTKYLAGSWVFTDACIGKAIQYAGIGLGEAIDMAGARPRNLLGLPEQNLTVGAATSLVLFDWEPGGEMTVQKIIDRFQPG